jgi:hypothetical protein
MNETEIIQALKTNTRQFRDLSAEETAWAIAHYADMQYGSANGVRRFKITTNFASEYVHRLRADYPAPAEPPTMVANTEQVAAQYARLRAAANAGFAAECELAEEAVLLNQAKNNLYPLGSLRKHDPDLAKLIESVPITEVVLQKEDGAWIRKDSGSTLFGASVYRVHKDWQPPKPEEEEPEAPKFPHIDGWKYHGLGGPDGLVAVLYLPEAR